MENLDSSVLVEKLITEILTPYLSASRSELIQSIGRDNFTKVEDLYRMVNQASARDDKAQRTLALFEEDPETYNTAFALIIERLLDQDDQWVLEILPQIKAFVEPQHNHTSVTGGGAVAAHEGTAAGEMGVAVKGSVAGGIHIYGTTPPEPTPDMTEPERLLWQEQATYLAEAMRAYSARLKDKLQKVSSQQRLPYKNLFYYEVSDAHIFFGREQAIQQFLNHIKGYGKSRRLTILHAPSGSGKTSLINAGITPALLGLGDVTLYALARVGTDYENPAAAIRKQILDAAPANRPEPDLFNLSLRNFLRLATVGLDGQALVIYLDQFEEFFIHLHPEARAPFIKDLAACYDDDALPVKFIISIRKDYFSDIGELSNVIPTVFYNQFRLEPLTRAEATEAITKPIAPFGLRYSDDLVDALLFDLESNGMELPHLQILCSRLYEGRLDDTITLADYENLGGAEGILGGYLAGFMDQLGPLRAVAQDILIELVTSENTKRVMSRAELGTRVGEKDLDEVLTRLVSGRLLRRDEDGGDARYEMAHEYLIREITKWIDGETRARKQAEELLAQEVYAWQQFGTLIGADKLDIIADQREVIRTTRNAQELLLRSALANGHDLALWPELMSDSSSRKQILAEFSNEPRIAVRSQAAWVWSNLDEPDSIPALIDLAFEDKSPVVRTAASEGLLRLDKQREPVLRKLVSLTRSDDRHLRSQALTILTRVRLDDLEPTLRWRLTITRLRLALGQLYDQFLPHRYRRSIAIGISVIFLLFVGLYGFLANSSYLDVVRGSASGDDNLIVVRNGHPLFQPLPGFDRVVVETDFWLNEVESKEKEKLSNGQMVTFSWQNDRMWVQNLQAQLTPMAQAYNGWYLDGLAETAIENLMMVMNDNESSHASILGLLEQVMIRTDDTAVTQQTIDRLTLLLDNEDGNVQAAGIVGLSRTITPVTDQKMIDQVVLAISPYLRDDNYQVTITALESLRHIMAVANDPIVSQQIIDIFADYLGGEAQGNLNYSLFYNWIDTVIAMDDPATANYALERLFNLEDVLRSDEYATMLDRMLYPLTNYIYQKDDKVIAIEAIEAMAPLLNKEHRSVYWPVMDLLFWANSTDPEVAGQTVDLLIPYVSSQVSERFWFADGYWKIVQVLGDAAMLTDDPAIANRVYSKLKPLVNHANPSVRYEAIWYLGESAAITKDDKIINEAMTIAIKLSSDQNQTETDREIAIHNIGILAAKANKAVAEDGISHLKSLIENDGPEIRDLAISNLGLALHNPSITDQIFELLLTYADDREDDVRIATSQAAGNVIWKGNSPLTVRQGIGIIGKLLQDEVIEVRFSASRALYFSVKDRFSPEAENENSAVITELFTTLPSFLDQDNPYADEIVHEVLANTALEIEDNSVASEAVVALLPLLNIESIPSRIKIINHLAIVTPKSDDIDLINQVISELLPLVDSEDNKIQNAAINGLGKLIREVENPQLASEVSWALGDLLKGEDPDLRSSAFDTSVQARSWFDMEDLFAQIQNPADRQERNIASRALLLVIMRDSTKYLSLKEEINALKNHPEPFIRYQANQVLEMLYVATIVHGVEEGSRTIDSSKLYLYELMPKLYENPYGSPESLYPNPASHIEFAVKEALAKLDEIEKAQSE